MPSCIFSIAFSTPPATRGKSDSPLMITSITCCELTPILASASERLAPNASSRSLDTCGIASFMIFRSSPKGRSVFANCCNPYNARSSSARPFPTVATALPNCKMASLASSALIPIACNEIEPLTASSNPRPGSLATSRNSSNCCLAASVDPATAANPFSSDCSCP